jgi:hypothetical protein
MAKDGKKWAKHLAERIEAAMGDPDRTYRRPGYPAHMELSAEWWRLYDQAAAARARQAARWGDPALLVPGFRGQGGSFGGPGMARFRTFM